MQIEVIREKDVDERFGDGKESLCSQLKYFAAIEPRPYFPDGLTDDLKAIVAKITELTKSGRKVCYMFLNFEDYAQTFKGSEQVFVHETDKQTLRKTPLVGYLGDVRVCALPEGRIAKGICYLC